MRHGYTVAVAAAFIAALGQIAAAEAACNPRNPTACTSDSQPGAAAAPLELKRFMALGPARRAVSGSQARRPVRKAPAKQAIDPAAHTKRTASADAGAEPLIPKPVPTVSIAAPSLASVPATEIPSAGFAAAAEPSTGESAFASADEVNAIDLAADLEAKASDHAGKSDRTAGVSLMTQANAAPWPQPSATTPPAKPETSWLSRLYGKLIDGVLAAVLAIRSIFA